MITVTFTDFDDMRSQVLYLADLFKKAPAQAVAETTKKSEPEEGAITEEEKAEIFREIDKQAAAKKTPERPGSNVPEQPTVPPMPKPAEPEAPKVDRVALRKILNALNKTTGENTAKKLINDMGFSALTNVPYDRLAELKAKAEEVIYAS